MTQQPCFGDIMALMGDQKHNGPAMESPQLGQATFVSSNTPPGWDSAWWSRQRNQIARGAAKHRLWIWGCCSVVFSSFIAGCIWRGFILGFTESRIFVIFQGHTFVFLHCGVHHWLCVLPSPVLLECRSHQAGFFSSFAPCYFLGSRTHSGYFSSCSNMHK